MIYLTHGTDYIPDAINRHFVISFGDGFLFCFVLFFGGEALIEFSLIPLPPY